MNRRKISKKGNSLFFLDFDKKMFFGVCGGLETMTGISRWIFRLLFVALNFYSYFGFAIYLILCIALCDKNKDSYQPKLLGSISRIAKKFNIDISILRIIVTILVLITGIVPGLLLYTIFSGQDKEKDENL